MHPTEPIKIEMHDLLKYTNTAILVDREDFQEDLIVVRRKLGLKKLITHNKIPIWEKKYRNKVFEMDKELLSEGVYFGSNQTALDQMIESILKKYSKSLVFTNVIKSAILCGEIHDIDYGYARAEIILTDMPLAYTEPLLVLVISSETKSDHINSVLKNSQKLFEQYNKLIYKKQIKLFDTKQEIANIRKWYWLNKDGLSYSKIEAFTKKTGEFTSKEAIKMAIIRYRSLLNSPILSLRA